MTAVQATGATALFVAGTIAVVLFSLCKAYAWTGKGEFTDEDRVAARSTAVILLVALLLFGSCGIDKVLS